MKRRLAIVLLLLAGGAVMNVAVAWGCLRWSEAEWDQALPRPADWAPRPRLQKEISQAHVCDGPIGKSGVPSTVVARFCFWGLCEDSAHRGVLWLLQYDAGWPLLALRMERWTVRGYEPVHRGVLQVSAFTVDGREFQHEALPLEPLPSGFIINTLFYALLLWLLFFTRLAARRTLRRRRGQCEKCAYPIGVSPVCTECGAAVPGARKANV